MRLPKSRGFKRFFKLIKKIVPLNLDRLEADDRITDSITVEMLYTLGYGKAGHSFKILGSGELKKALKVE